MARDITINLKINRAERNLKKYVERKMSIIVGQIASFVKSKLSISNSGGSNPSQPGEYPHLGSGQLRASIRATIGMSGDSVDGVVYTARGPASPYAARIHNGRGGSDSDARPFLAKAVNAFKPNIIRILRQ